MSGDTMAIVSQIEETIEHTIKEFTILGQELRDVNAKLLPAEPRDKESEQPTCQPRGWFEQILQRIRHLRDVVIEIRIEESERLKRAVAAGEVTKTETALKPGKF